MLLAAWLAFSGVILIATGHPPLEALKILFFLQADSTSYGFFYESMTDFVVFGLVISVLLVDMQRQVRPEASCRVMAQELHNHAVIFHFTNLGRRTWQLLSEKDIPVAVVDPNPDHLESLIRDGYPCLVSSGRSQADMEDTNIREARFVMVAADDLESATVICSLVRQHNSKCDLVVRCLEDEIGEVLAKRYRATLISTSRVAAAYLKDYMATHRVRSTLVVGDGSLARRVIPIVQDLRVEYHVICDEVHRIDDLVDPEHYLVGDSYDVHTLEAAGVGEVDLVILTEDDLSQTLKTVDKIRSINGKCKIVCRVFHDDAADVLSSPPFRCDIFSTSRGAVEQLRKQGALKALGVVS